MCVYIKKTLATRSANGFDTVFEVWFVNYVWSTRSFFCVFFRFFSPWRQLRAVRVSQTVPRLCCGMWRDGVCWRHSIKRDGNTECLWFWSTPEMCPVSRTRQIAACAKRSFWHRRGCEQKYWAYSASGHGLCMLERVWPISRRADNGSVVFCGGI